MSSSYSDDVELQTRRLFIMFTYNNKNIFWDDMHSAPFEARKRERPQLHDSTTPQQSASIHWAAETVNRPSRPQIRSVRFLSHKNRGSGSGSGTVTVTSPVYF